MFIRLHYKQSLKIVLGFAFTFFKYNTQYYDSNYFGEGDFLAGIASMHNIFIKAEASDNGVKSVELKMCQNFFTDLLRDKFQVVSNNMSTKWQDALENKFPKAYIKYYKENNMNGKLFVSLFIVLIGNQSQKINKKIKKLNYKLL